MTYNEIKTGEYFIINDLQPYPKIKTAFGYIDLRLKEEVLDKDIPESIKTDFDYQKITEEQALKFLEQYKDENN